MVRSVAICKTYEIGARVETLFYMYARAKARVQIIEGFENEHSKA